MRRAERPGGARRGARGLQPPAWLAPSPVHAARRHLHVCRAHATRRSRAASLATAGAPAHRAACSPACCLARRLRTVRSQSCQLARSRFSLRSWVELRASSGLTRDGAGESVTVFATCRMRCCCCARVVVAADSRSANEQQHPARGGRDGHRLQRERAEAARGAGRRRVQPLQAARSRRAPPNLLTSPPGSPACLRAGAASPRKLPRSKGSVNGGSYRSIGSESSAGGPKIMRNVQRSITQKKRQLTTLATGLFAVRSPPPPAQPRGERAPIMPVACAGWCGTV